MSSDITTNSGGRNEAVVESKPYQEIVPFYGRYSIILKNDKKCEAAAKSITISCQEIAKVAAKDPSWKCLQESLFSLQSSLLDPERTLREYHLDLLQEAILPYIRDMVSRIHFSKSRFHQLQVRDQLDDYLTLWLTFCMNGSTFFMLQCITHSSVLSYIL
jgi:hypothetical protein